MVEKREGGEGSSSFHPHPIRAPIALTLHPIPGEEREDWHARDNVTIVVGDRSASVEQGMASIEQGEQKEPGTDLVIFVVKKEQTHTLAHTDRQASKHTPNIFMAKIQGCARDKYIASVEKTHTQIEINSVRHEVHSRDRVPQPGLHLVSLATRGAGRGCRADGHPLGVA